jgi:rRNA-processing protein FCF1
MKKCIIFAIILVLCGCKLKTVCDKKDNSIGYICINNDTTFIVFDNCVDTNYIFRDINHVKYKAYIKNCNYDTVNICKSADNGNLSTYVRTKKSYTDTLLIEKKGEPGTFCPKIVLIYYTNKVYSKSN